METLAVCSHGVTQFGFAKASRAISGGARAVGLMRVRLARGKAVQTLLHAEFLELLHQALADADLPVLGKATPTPRYRLQSGPPLPPGFTSRCEYVDFELARPITSSEFQHRLSSVLPEGVDLLWARRLSGRTLALKAALRRIRYTFGGLFEPHRAELFHRTEQWPLTQIRKDRHRVLDLKQSITGLRVEPHQLIFDIEVREEGMPKPDEILASVFGTTLQETPGFTAERTAIHLGPPVPPRKATGNT